MIFWSLLAACSVAVTVAVTLTRRRYVVVQVVGTSMTPALSPGDRVLVRRGSRDQVRAGTIVVLPQPRDECLAWEEPATSARRLAGGRWVIKRVAAAPGDAVPDSVRGAVHGASVVPPGMVVVLGDSARSTDSRAWGFLPASDLLGAVVRGLPRLPDSGSGAAQATDRERHAS